MLQSVATVVAVVHVAPPSNETCTTSFVPSVAGIVPFTVRVALPSFVIKSVIEVPVSFVMLVIAGEVVLMVTP